MRCPILSCAARPQPMLFSPHERRLWLQKHYLSEHHRFVFLDGPEVAEAEAAENYEDDARLEYEQI